MLGHRPSPRNVSRSVMLVVTILILLGSLGSTKASVYYSLSKESQTTVSSPEVILQNGTAGTSTIYTNSTSAKVSVSGYGYDFVDNNTSDVDNSTDKGTHSNFSAQQYGPDSVNDTLREGNTKPNSEYVWVSGDDDFVRKLNRSDLGGTEILSWDTDTSYPYGCEFRIEGGNEYIYIVDPGAQVDALIKFHANNGTEVIRWDISGYSGDAWGLAWNGSRWFISDKNDDLIYQVDPANLTVQERSFTYTGIGIAAGLAWDGSYLWTVDFGNHYVYQMDVYGNIQTSWSSVNLTQPTGISYDTTSGHLWIVSKSTEYLYEYYINGTAITDWDPFPGSTPEGVAYASVEDTYNYELDLEVQWTSVDFDETYEELCIKTGTFSGSEDIMVYAWNVSTSDWHFLYNLTASNWNNVSVTDWLNNEDFTARFLGGTESSDTSQDSWNIDATLLHVWSDVGTTYDYVLRVNNTATTESWEIRLKKYAEANISRLQNCTIYFHNSTDGTSGQIQIENGNYTLGGDEGSWYDLHDSETIYIAMTVEANSTGTSYVRTYLEIRIPSTTTYAQYIITFEII